MNCNWVEFILIFFFWTPLSVNLYWCRCLKVSLFFYNSIIQNFLMYVLYTNFFFSLFGLTYWWTRSNISNLRVINLVWKDLKIGETQFGETWRLGRFEDWRDLKIWRLQDWRLLKDWRIERLKDWKIESFSLSNFQSSIFQSFDLQIFQSSNHRFISIASGLPVACTRTPKERYSPTE